MASTYWVVWSRSVICSFVLRCGRNPCCSIIAGSGHGPQLRPSIGTFSLRSGWRYLSPCCCGPEPHAPGMPSRAIVALHDFAANKSKLFVKAQRCFILCLHHQPPRLDAQRSQFRQRVIEQGLRGSVTPIARVHRDGSQLSVSASSARDAVSSDAAAQHGNKKQIRTTPVKTKEQLLIPRIRAERVLLYFQHACHVRCLKFPD